MSRALAAKRMRPAENISLHLIVDFSTQGRTISRFGVQLCASKHFLDGRIFDPHEHLSLKIPNVKFLGVRFSTLIH